MTVVCEPKLKSTPHYIFTWIVPVFLNLMFCISVSKYGIGLSTDSANYVSSAENLLKGNGLILFNGELLQNAPPLFPFILASLKFTQFNWFKIGLIINLLSLNLSFLFIYKLINRSFKLSVFPWILAFSCCFYWAFIHGFQMLLTEGVFITIMLGCFWVLISEKRGFFKELSLPFLITLLCLTRYAGLMMIPGFCLYFWVLGKSKTWIALQILPAFVVSGIWFLRNLLLNGHFLGEHVFSQKLDFFGLVENIRHINGFNVFFLTPFLLVFYALVQKEKKWSKLFLLSGFTSCSYLILLIFQVGLSINQLPRYLALVEIPLYFMVAEFAFRVFDFKVFRVLTLVFVLIKGGLLLNKTYQSKKNGAGGFHTTYWQLIKNDPILKQDLGDELACNFPDMYYWITGKQAVYTPFLGEKEPSFYPRLIGKKKIIWFKSNERNHVMEPNPNKFFGKTQLETILETENLCVMKICVTQ